MKNSNVRYRKNASWDIRLIELPLIGEGSCSVKEQLVRELSRVLGEEEHIDIVEIKPTYRDNKVVYAVGYALLEQIAS